MEQFGFHWTDFHEIRWAFFENLSRKFKFLSCVTRMSVTLLEDFCACTYVTISRWIILRTRNVSDKSYRENRNTHFMFAAFSLKSCSFWDKVEKYGIVRLATDGSIIRRKCFACWVPKVQTHSRNMWYCFSTARMVMRTHLNVTLYIRCLSFFF